MSPTVGTTNRVLGVLLDVAFVALLATILAAVVVGRIVPLTGHPTLVVAGGSMAPAIGVGSAIIVDPVDPAALAVGDVVSLQEAPGRTTYTHRITRIVERDGARWLETKGDANAAPDPSLIAATGVIGRVAIVLPLLGFAIALMAQATGVASVLALAAALVVARSLVSSAPNAGRRAGIERLDRARPDGARPDGVATIDVFAGDDVAGDDVAGDDVAGDGGTDRDAAAPAIRSSRAGPESARKRAASARPERAAGARERQGTARPRAVRALPAD